MRQIPSCLAEDMDYVEKKWMADLETMWKDWINQFTIQVGKDDERVSSRIFLRNLTVKTGADESFVQWL